jgi:glycosyltransferase involved in cell wall biosynthesis
VIPTYNRLPLLRKVIAALQNQTNAPEFEIIVVDDGSEEAVQNAISGIPGIRKIFQQNSGPAVARNKGVSEASGDYVVFIGDDTVPAHDFLFQHASFHKEADYDKFFACLGYTKWPDEYNVTPFMNHINNYGAQFGYKLIRNGAFVPFNFFYTSNISLNRKLLLEYPFDTSFPAAAWEDIELGYRLSQLGLKIRYNANAITSHYHPMDITSFSKRQFTVGKSAVFFYKKHPHLINMLAIDRLSKYHPLRGAKLSLIKFQIWLSGQLKFYKAKSAYNKIITDSYMSGLKEGFQANN